MKKLPIQAASGLKFSTEILESSIGVQAVEIAASLSLGICMGFIYELFRLPRHLFPSASFLFDFIFCLCFGAGVFVLGMACGGNLRFYMPFAALMGAWAYWLLLGKKLRPLMLKLEKLGAKGWLKLKRLIKKLLKIIKNIFSFFKKRFRMVGYTKDGKLGGAMSKSGVREAQRKGKDHEISQNGHTDKVYYPGSAHIRSLHDI